jgi:hypothetical protein
MENWSLFIWLRNSQLLHNLKMLQPSSFGPIQSQLNPVHSLTPYLSNNYFSIRCILSPAPSLPSVLVIWSCPTKFKWPTYPIIFHLIILRILGEGHKLRRPYLCNFYQLPIISFFLRLNTPSAFDFQTPLTYILPLESECVFTALTLIR